MVFPALGSILAVVGPVPRTWSSAQGIVREVSSTCNPVVKPPGLQLRLRRRCDALDSKQARGLQLDYHPCASMSILLRGSVRSIWDQNLGTPAEFR